MAFRVKHIDHVELLVRDIGKTEAWYGKVLGLKRVQAWDPEPVMIGAGKTMLALFTSSRARGRMPGKNRKKNGHRVSFGYLRVAFLTDKKGFKLAQKRLEKLGIPFRGPIDHDISFSIYFQDLNGLPLEITHDKR